MTQVKITPEADAALDDLIETRSLPHRTPDLVRRQLAVLGEFPESGRALEGAWHGYRMLVGPWGWLLVVYRFDVEADTVQVVTFQDSRTRSAASSSTT